MIDRESQDPVGGVPGLDRRTTPTWEMELLLSGALVFGLVQLPREVDGLMYPAFIRVGTGAEMLVLLIWIYAKVALLTLIGTFVLHLVARGYWVALVGLDSVYPGGIRWDRLRIGPHLRAVSEGDVPGGMPARIEGADNRASRIFGVGVGLALAMIVPLLLVGVGALVDLLLHAVLPVPPRHPWGLSLAGGLIIAYGVLYAIDRWWGSRIGAETLAGRAMRAVFGRLGWLGVGNSANALVAIFQGAEGAIRTSAVILAVLLPVLGIVTFQLVADAEGWEIGSFPGLPDDRPGVRDVVLPGHYANQRGDGRTARPLPFIPDRVVRGPYLELFVPYVPRRDAAAVEARCPASREPADSSAAPRELLDCVGSLFPIELDGQPVPVRFDAAADPVTGGRGLLAMVPVSDLASGRHELRIGRPQPPGRDRAGKKRPQWWIPFWR